MVRILLISRSLIQDLIHFKILVRILLILRSYRCSHDLVNWVITCLVNTIINIRNKFCSPPLLDSRNLRGECWLFLEELNHFNILGTGHYLWKGGGGGKNKGGAICRNKWLEGGAIKFFQENDGGGAVQLNLKEFA